MNAILNTAILSVIAINANNFVLMGDAMFEDCGLDFDLLTEKEEVLYDKYFQGVIKTHKYSEDIRLNEVAINRANAYLRNRAF